MQVAISRRLRSRLLWSAGVPQEEARHEGRIRFKKKSTAIRVQKKNTKIAVFKFTLQILHSGKLNMYKIFNPRRLRLPLRFLLSHHPPSRAVYDLDLPVNRHLHPTCAVLV